VLYVEQAPHAKLARVKLSLSYVENKETPAVLIDHRCFGHVVAHEIGHLLLGPGSHSTSGIMQCSWHLKQLAIIARGLMTFTPGEAGRMRANIRARMAGQEAG
jgi:hypothetical protein